MVWLAKWIRENVEDARVLIITDRTELDEQIEKVFEGVSEQYSPDQKRGRPWLHALSSSGEWLIASLIHKFGAAEDGDLDAYFDDIRSHDLRQLSVHPGRSVRVRGRVPPYPVR